MSIIMNAQFIRFTTEDALILQGIIYQPSHETKKVYLHIHGMGGNFYENRFIDVMVDRIAGIGYAFASVNTRGHDTISDFPIKRDKEEYKRIGNAFEVFEECVLDIRAAINHLETLGYQEIVLCGHSLGAVKVVYYLATSSDARVSRLVLMSPPDMVALAEADDAHEEFTDTAKQMMKDGKGEELLPKKLWAGIISLQRHIWIFLAGIIRSMYLIFTMRQSHLCLKKFPYQRWHFLESMMMLSSVILDVP
jgi:predicted alpha/beta-fold hydrolase